MKKIHTYSILWGLVVITILILLTIFGFVYKNKTKVYKELEEKLVEVEKKYVDAKFLYPKEGQVLKTTSKELEENNYIDKLPDDCVGYAEVTMDGTIYNYKGYIKCEKYITKGYKESN